MGQVESGVFFFDAPTDYAEEVVLVCEPTRGTRVVVRTAKHAPGVPLETLVARLLREASRMVGYALVELSPRSVGGRPALRARIRSNVEDGVLAQTVVFVDAPGDELATFACATTRASEATREVVTAEQASLLDGLLATVRFSAPTRSRQRSL